MRCEKCVVSGLFFAMIALSMASEGFAQGAKPFDVSKLEEVDGGIVGYEFMVPDKIGQEFQLTRVQRGGDTTLFEVILDANSKPAVKQIFKLAKFTKGGASEFKTASHMCRPSPGADRVGMKFTGEAWERIVPPNDEAPAAATPTEPIAPLRIINKDGGIHLFVGKFTLRQASGQFYLNGEVSQVITDYKGTVTSGGKTITLTPKPLKEDVIDPSTGKKVEPKAVPRFDGSVSYLFQFRVFETLSGGKKNYLAVVAGDTPGPFFIATGAKGDYYGLEVGPGDKVVSDISFSTYFWEDCNADGTLGLATHRVDWTVHAELNLGDPMGIKSTSLSTLDTNTNVFPDPVMGADSPFAKAVVNDNDVKGGKESKGWTPKKETIVTSP